MAEARPDSPVRGMRFWAFVTFMLLLMAAFIALGTWQVARMAEKEQLIANVSERFSQPPKPFPAPSDWGQLLSGDYDFQPVTLRGAYEADKTVLVFTSLGDAKGQYSGPGYWVVTPMTLEGGGTLFVNRGFVPQASGPDFSSGEGVEAGPVEVTGVLRADEPVGSFTPAPDTKNRVEWVRNAVRLSAMAGDVAQPVAPVTLDLPAGPSGALPQGGETVLEFPNNHLGYIMTWYGFALLVPFLLFFWILRQRPRGGKV